MSFTGEFRHTVDNKGRLIVPSRIRDELEEGQVVLTKYFNGCVAMWSRRGWEDLERSLLLLGRSKQDARAVVRLVAASAHQDEVDRQGRITLPGVLRDYAGIDRAVIVTGALDHGEVWSPEGWAAEQEKVQEGRLDELAQELNF